MRGGNLFQESCKFVKFKVAVFKVRFYNIVSQQSSAKLRTTGPSFLIYFSWYQYHAHFVDYHKNSRNKIELGNCNKGPLILQRNVKGRCAKPHERSKVLRWAVFMKQKYIFSLDRGHSHPKIIYPKYSKHDVLTLAHTIECVCFSPLAYFISFIKEI